MLRKKLDILWAFAEPGIMLQHLPTNTFFELSEIQERIWSYIDGTHSREAIIERMIADYPNLDTDEAKTLTNTTIDSLLENQLIVQN